MKRNTFTLVSGLTLILIGAVVMLGNYYLGTKAWKLWPIIVVLIGMGLTAPGFFGFSKQGLGSFFIPGLPMLATGAILLYASIMDKWEVWSVAWPLLILALALGFALASIFMRVPGLAIPASILGINGIVFAFCAYTGLWKAWAILWPAEFLSVGIGLLIFSIAEPQPGARQASSILFSIAGASFFFMAFFSSSLNNNPILRYVSPIMLVSTGILLISAFIIKDNSTIDTDPIPAIEPIPAE